MSLSSVLMESSTFTVHDAQFQKAYEEIKQQLVASSIPVSHFNSYFDYDFQTGMISLDGLKAFATAELPDSVLDASSSDPPFTYQDFSSATKSVSSSASLKITYGGEYLASVESNRLILESLTNSETSAAPILLVLLIFAFDGVVALIMPFSLILWNIVVTFALLRVLATGFHVSTYTTDVTLIFGAGLAIDFSLFLHLRFTEEMMLRRRNLTTEDHKEEAQWTTEDVYQSVDRTLKTSGRTVVFSAVVLTATLVGALQFHEYFLTTMVLAIILPAIASAIGAVTFLPVIYLLMGERIFYGSVRPVRLFVISKCKKLFPSSSAETAVAHSLPEKVSSAPTSSAPTTDDQDVEKNNVVDIENQVVPIEETVADEHLQSGSHQEVLGNDFKTTSNVNRDKEDDNITDPIAHNSSNDGDKNEEEDKFIEPRESIKKPLPLANETPRVNHGNDLLYTVIIFVMKYPWPFIILLSAGFISLLYIFVTQVKFGNQSYGSFPLDSPTRYVIETIIDDFPHDTNGQGSLTVFLQTSQAQDIRSDQFIRVLYDFCQSLPIAVDTVSGVTSITTVGDNFTLSDYLTYYADPFNPTHANFTRPLITPFHLTDFDRLTVVNIATSIAVSDDRLGVTVRGVRKFVGKTFQNLLVTDSTTGDEYPLVQVYGTGGDLATQYDLNKDIISVLPDVIIVLLLSMYFFIVLLTGSIVLPLKVIFCAGLSICASFGFLVLLIQDGNGEDFLQFRNNLKCLDPLQLIFIFVVAFGLSLDYEIFLLGRIQELYVETKDNFHSVAQGISSSGATITLAAALLCTAIGGFISSEVLLLKQIGIGIGMTIFIDATVVRCLLVPALMSVMGDWNWYAPSFVKETVKFFDIQH
jgi:uncharacterized membrane protein YdfJ with MMPL/SSD domain